jgi:hypothetical protein
MRRLARWAGICAGGLFALFFLTAFGLVLVPAPKLAFPIAEGGASALPCAESPEVRCIEARDGIRLALRRTLDAPPFSSGEPGPVVLFLHGVLTSGAEPEIAATARKAPAPGGEASGPSLIKAAIPRIVGLALLNEKRGRGS